MQYPPDPPRPEEIILVIGQPGQDRHALRIRALIAALWRAELRISEALALNETDIDERRGWLLIRHGKGDKRRGAASEETRAEDLISVGFVMTAVGIGLLIGLVHAASSSVWAFAPGLLLIGLGLGVMLTPSVNLVQSAFPAEQQGETSGLSRSVSNLGSSFGTAIAGTILVSNLVSGNGTYVAAMIVLAVVALAGLAIATRLPANPVQAGDSDVARPPRHKAHSTPQSDRSHAATALTGRPASR